MASFFDPVLGVASDLASPLWGILGVAPSRRVAPGPARTHLEVRGMHHEGTTETRRLVEKKLAALPGVRAAAVNAVMGRVVVDHDPSMTLIELLAVIDEVEEAHGLVGAEVPAASTHHPADSAALTRQLIALGVDLAGLSALLAERALLTLPVTSGLVPPATTAVLSLVDSVPFLRALVERTAGASATESWFSLGSSSAQALGRGPVGLVADACYRGLRSREAGARLDAWRELDAAVGIEEHRVEPGADPEVSRPVTLRQGAVQRVGDAAGAGALGAMAVVAAVTPARATAVVLAGTPRAARWGWEAFAAAAGHALARRAVVVLDPAALRRADRIDVVVVDADLPDAVVRAARAVGRVVVTTAASSAETITGLQSEGHGVALVSADPDAAAALAAADVAVFVGSRDDTRRPAPVWTADLLCPDVDTALAVLGVLAAAPDGARRAAALAVLASCAALPLAVLAPLPGLSVWASLPVTSAALISLGVGTWTGAGAVPTASPSP